MGRVDDRLGRIEVGLAALGLIVAVMAGGVLTSDGGFASALGVGGEEGDTAPTEQGPEFNANRDIVGIEFPARTASETFVLVPVEGGSPAVSLTETQDVTTVGSDSDDSDTQELINAEEPEEGEDYFTYTSGDSQIQTDVPKAGEYRLAVIGGGVVNTYQTVELPETVSEYRLDNTNPIRLLDDSVDTYATGATEEDVRVNDGDSTIALQDDFSADASDANVDGTVTGITDYEVDGTDAQLAFGEISISSVNDSVDDLTVTVFVDGEQVVSRTDSDFGDGEGLDDGVEFGAVTAEDDFRVETEIDFDDASMTSAGDLVTVSLDDTDEDGESQDGSYGISALTQTITGY
jgi:hypothetical protein